MVQASKDFDATQDVTPSVPSNYDVARAMHQRLPYGNDDLVCRSALELVMRPAMEPLGTAELYEEIQQFLSPETETSRFSMRDLMADIGIERETPTLRDLVYPPKKFYSVTGDEGNRSLARLLNRLTALTDEFQQSKFDANGVYKLPEDKATVLQRELDTERAEELTQRKAGALQGFYQEVRRFLFDPNANATRIETNRSFEWLEANVIGGDEIGKKFNKLLDQLHNVGFHMSLSPDATLEEAVDIGVKTRELEARLQAKRDAGRDARGLNA